jgi:hypothetical protein
MSSEASVGVRALGIGVDSKISSSGLNKSLIKFPEKLVADVPFTKTLNTLESQRM